MGKDRVQKGSATSQGTVSTVLHIGELTPDPDNARRHTPRNVGTIVEAIHEVGAARSIVIDENGVILAGNATVEAAAEAGLTKVQVVDTDGETIVAVRRMNLTPAQKTRLALYDNRTAELADNWNIEMLQALRDRGVPLEGLWTEHELEALFNATVDNPAEHWRGMPGFEQQDLEGWKTIRIHFATKDDYEAFARVINQALTERTNSIWYPARKPEVFIDKAYVGPSA